MCDMIINDTVPVDKKWNELIKYNIFIMKLVEFVVAVLLNIIPVLVEPPAFWHCLVAGPTLVLSVIFIVLYIVDQVPYEAEMYYAVFEIAMTVIGLLCILIKGKLILAIYALFYIDLIIIFAMDIHYMHKERGWNF